MEENNLGKVQVKVTDFAIILLMLIVCGITYLCCSDYLGKNATEIIDSTSRILILKVSDSANNYSDSTQGKNVINKGGTIILKDFDSDSINAVFGEYWNSYGGADANGYHYLDGALLNYIASKGWNLIQAPSTGLGSTYYFTK